VPRPGRTHLRQHRGELTCHTMGHLGQLSVADLHGTVEQRTPQVLELGDDHGADSPVLDGVQQSAGLQHQLLDALGVHPGLPSVEPAFADDGATAVRQGGGGVAARSSTEAE